MLGVSSWACLCAVQEAGIPIKLASTIGISVDHRRRNRSLEGLQVQNCDSLSVPSPHCCSLQQQQLLWVEHNAACWSSGR
jgi:Ribosomal protein L13e